MASIGERNALRVVRETKSGLYLDGETLGEILLPGRYIPKGTTVGSFLEVFVHKDSEDRLVATTEIPRACVGDFAALKVIGIKPDTGAFLDWGLSKDLLLPNREQARRVQIGETVVAYIYIDERSQRIAASTRLDRHFSKDAPALEEGQQVPILISDETPMGYKAVVDNAHSGMVYKSDLGSPLEVGQPLKAFVRTVRPDGKIDLNLNPAGHKRIGPLSDQILEALRQAQGNWLPVNDESSPDAIRMQFGMSKKAFKQAIGALYKQRLIEMADGGIRLVKP